MEREILRMILTFRPVQPAVYCGWAVRLWSGDPLLSPNSFTWDHLNKIKWFIANETSIGFPDRAKRDIFLREFLSFVSNSGLFCGQGDTL